jgi:hypothetical protein
MAPRASRSALRSRARAGLDSRRRRALSAARASPHFPPSHTHAQRRKLPPKLPHSCSQLRLALLQSGCSRSPRCSPPRQRGRRPPAHRRPSATSLCPRPRSRPRSDGRRRCRSRKNACGRRPERSGPRHPGRSLLPRHDFASGATSHASNPHARPPLRAFPSPVHPPPLSQARPHTSCTGLPRCLPQPHPLPLPPAPPAARWRAGPGGGPQARPAWRPGAPRAPGHMGAACEDVHVYERRTARHAHDWLTHTAQLITIRAPSVSDVGQSDH